MFSIRYRNSEMLNYNNDDVKKPTMQSPVEIIADSHGHSEKMHAALEFLADRGCGDLWRVDPWILHDVDARSTHDWMSAVRIEAVSKLHLALNGCVAIRFKMLTYSVYAPLLNRIDALPLNTIYNFETASKISIFTVAIQFFLPQYFS